MVKAQNDINIVIYPRPAFQQSIQWLPLSHSLQIGESYMHSVDVKDELVNGATLSNLVIYPMISRVTADPIHNNWASLSQWHSRISRPPLKEQIAINWMKFKKNQRLTMVMTQQKVINWCSKDFALKIPFERVEHVFLLGDFVNPTTFQESQRFMNELKTNFSLNGSPTELSNGLIGEWRLVNFSKSARSSPPFRKIEDYNYGTSASS